MDIDVPDEEPSTVGRDRRGALTIVANRVWGQIKSKKERLQQWKESH